MAEKMVMLALSPTMEEGTIVSWHKKEGDSVASGDVVCEVETDKATMDYESMQEGTLLKILVSEGGNAVVEQPIAVIGEEGEDFSALLEEVQASPAEDKASATPSQSTGKAVKENTGQVPALPAIEGGRIKASPLARSMAAEAGIDLHSITGSGPEGRIVKRDLESLKAETTPTETAAATAGPTGIVERRIPLSRKRRVIAQRLSESKFTAPHFYLKASISTDTMAGSRAQLNREREKQDLPKISLNAFLMKLTAEAIKRHPIVNAGWEEEEIHIFGSIDIGLAVALEDGLITPVVRNCGGKGVAQIDEELWDLISRARKGRLNPEEYTGATFSISNLGSYGVEEFTAIINPPASAILAVGSVEKVPVALEDNSISFDNRMKVNLSCDHRVIDGAAGAEFLRDLKSIIEDPLRALI